MMKRLLLPLVAALLLLNPAVALCEDATQPEKEPTVKDVKKAADEAQGKANEALNSADTAWMLVSTGLVLLMVPGLALFYGGMVRRKNVLATMMHSMIALGILGVQWLVIGYALAFGDSHAGFIGWNPDYVALWNVPFDKTYPGTNIPIYLHCMYQGMFAIITPALISGAVAERVKFAPYCLFLMLWSLFVYVPLAHWVWAVDGDGNPAGWLGKMGALDFAGGTVVHVAAGVSGLAAILVLRKRIGYPEHAMHPNSMVLTLVGAGLLWFGWFGFNGGSALHANAVAASALTASQVAAAAAVLGWLGAEWLHRGKPTALGLASGLVAGLVVITPASGFVAPWAALCMGLIGGVVCYGAVALKPMLKYDDSLDAFGVHGVGGFLGAVLTGVFASAALVKASFSGDTLPGGLPAGGLVSGGAARVGVQLLAALMAAGWAFGLSLALVKAVDLALGFTTDARSESEGLDRTEHGEVGFDMSLATEATPEAAPPAPRPASVPPNGQRHFTIIVEGAKQSELMHAWSGLCQAGVQPTPEFRQVYPYVTTVSGNRFRFRGGDPAKLRYAMQKLFQDRLDGA